jgi:hypothetical protein
MAPSPHADPDPTLFREVQSLRGRVCGLEDDNEDLKRRLAYASMEVERLRAQLLATKPILRVAEPVDREHGGLVPVTSAELDTALARLHDVRPLHRLPDAWATSSRSTGSRSQPFTNSEKVTSATTRGSSQITLR